MARKVSKKTGGSLHSTDNPRVQVSYPRGRTGKEFIEPTYEASSRGKTATAKGEKERYTHARRGRAVYSK